jgi:hypothetical protein
MALVNFSLNLNPLDAPSRPCVSLLTTYKPRHCHFAKLLGLASRSTRRVVYRELAHACGGMIRRLK